MAEQTIPQAQVQSKLSKFELCKSGRPKKLVAQELERERAYLNDLHIRVTVDRERRIKSDARINSWKDRWKTERPNEPIDMEEYPYKVYNTDQELVEQHHRQHYVVAALEDELEGIEEK